MSKENKFPIYASNGCHYYKIIDLDSSVEVLPLERVEITCNPYITVNRLSDIKNGELKEIKQVEFNLYFTNTLKHLKTLQNGKD